MKRILSYIKGFDDLIEGGFVEGSLNLLAGPAGSGKTLFAMQFIYRAAENGENCVYICLEESKKNLIRASAGFGWNIQKYIDAGRIILIDIGDARALSADDELISFATIQDLLLNLFSKHDLKRLVIDSLGSIGLYYDSLKDLRRAVFKFARFLKRYDVTTLLITESLEHSGLTRFGIEQFIADSFIFLNLENIKGDLRRTIVVRKMRFTEHDITIRPVRITSKGLVVEADARVF
jgi:KaiC/GvpD/RAD55 family RecA-like ATPase